MKLIVTELRFAKKRPKWRIHGGQYWSCIQYTAVLH